MTIDEMQARHRSECELLQHRISEFDNENKKIKEEFGRSQENNKELSALLEKAKEEKKKIREAVRCVEQFNQEQKSGPGRPKKNRKPFNLSLNENTLQVIRYLTHNQAITKGVVSDVVNDFLENTWIPSIISKVGEIEQDDIQNFNI